MPQILLTGATGFVGRRLLTALRSQNELYALARRPPSDAGGGVRWIRHDLTAPLQAGSLPSRIDAVIHLAQSRHYREFPERADDIFRVNLQATQQLLEYARRAGAQRFLLASSGGVYGCSYERLCESAPVNPLNFYLSSKYAAELLLGSYQSYFHTIVFRFFFIYGPGQREMLIPRLLQKVKRGEPIAIEGEPGLRTNPIYIDDAVSAFEPALELDRSELFNVAGNETVSLTELVNLCGEAVGRKPQIHYGPQSRHGDLVGSNERLKDVLGVAPAIRLREGLGRMARNATPAAALRA